MLHTVTFRALAIAACGWLLALDAAALTLGRARGAVLVGRPLELTIPATLDAPSTDPCASADLFYGEQRVSRPPAVRWESRDGKEGVVRVSSELPVDEPMVTVYLRVGCVQPSARRYVLLAEVPPEEASGSPGRAVAASVPVVPSAPAAAAPSVVRRPPAVPRPKPPATAREPARPVLKLEPLDLAIDHAPTLRPSAEIGTQPTSDPAARQAAAAQWQALQKGPEGAMRETQRVQAVQRELQSLHDVNRQNAAAVAGMRAEVEQAHSRRNLASLLALVLATLLAAVLAALGWRWYRHHRVARVGRWFEAHGKAAALPPSAAAARPPPPDVLLDVDPIATTSPGTLPTAAIPAARPASPPAAAPMPWGPSSMQDFQASRAGSFRMVGVEELMDVHDKADFFLAIGEVDQAVAVLEGHVHDQVETGALPWMDLLELYHSLGRRADFERLRGEFRERFSAQVPDFEHFDQPTPTLEDYGRALSRIVALWPTRRVLDVIEESIFRKPGLPGADSFSLEAYRELVLLYHIAADLSPADEVRRDEPRVTRFAETSLQPLHPFDVPGRPSPDVDLLLVPPSSPNVGVDIDVTAPDDDLDTLPPLDFDLDSRQDELPGAGRGRP